MRKFPLKMKIILFAVMMLFMLFYMVVFGSKNAAIGMMIVMAAFMGLGNDLSFKAKLSNIVNENIEVTDENRELFYTQVKITDICNFILTYMDIFEFSQEFKEYLFNIIDTGFEIKDDLKIKEKSIAYSAEYVLRLFERENLLVELL